MWKLRRLDKIAIVFLSSSDSLFSWEKWLRPPFLSPAVTFSCLIVLCCQPLPSIPTSMPSTKPLLQLHCENRGRLLQAANSHLTLRALLHPNTSWFKSHISFAGYLPWSPNWGCQGGSEVQGNWLPDSWVHSFSFTVSWYKWLLCIWHVLHARLCAKCCTCVTTCDPCHNVVRWT